MINTNLIVFYIIASYLLGAIPTGYIAGYVYKRIDIREYGSKNIGFTNVLRVLGTVPSVVVLICDIAKGFVPVFLCKYIFKNQTNDFVLIAVGIATIVGHNWTVFLNFNGGKGVNTSVGVWLAIEPRAILIVLFIWALVLYLTRYMSLSNVVASILLSILIFFFSSSPVIIIFAIITMLLVIYRHKENIQRLLKNEERKIGEKIELDAKK
ncbi:glycerol-3-phosphate 1-O-acyltransferase PlsY [Candidatus Desantisbacteria bacterium]|nr:glycerol-3-phosphate 1-O-acyltransferase PlsY [Candidatus Desantisbacteria bacterium]